jgi:UDPglucose 6-dehydrogenase
MKIGFIGVGKLGGPVSEVMAKINEVDTYDPIAPSTVDSIEEVVKDKQLVFVAVPTPHEPEYDGRYVCSDLEPKDFDYSLLREVVEEANKYMYKDATLVIISTVLPGTIREIKKLVDRTNLVYNPYLIAMGTVKEDFIAPEMVIIGSDKGLGISALDYLYYSLCKAGTRIVKCSYEEAESIKIFYNTFITTKITLCNMIQDVAQKLGNMNTDVVTTALAESDYRIMGSKYMKAGMGDGGSCHPRDNIALRFLAQKLDLGYDMFSTIIKAREVQAKNMAYYLIELSEKHNLPIVILGKGFKPGLDYEDGSPSVLVGQFCECTYDDLSKPAVFLYAHSEATTFYKTNKEYDIPHGSVTVDPWRERSHATHWYGYSQ